RYPVFNIAARPSERCCAMPMFMPGNHVHIRFLIWRECETACIERMGLSRRRKARKRLALLQLRSLKDVERLAIANRLIKRRITQGVQSFASRPVLFRFF